jgi:hypothetical protein
MGLIEERVVEVGKNNATQMELIGRAVTQGQNSVAEQNAHIERWITQQNNQMQQMVSIIEGLRSKTQLDNQQL